MALRWGIASADRISHDFVNSLSTLSDDDHQVVAVTARDLDHAKKFAERFDIAKAYQGYQALAEDPDVEVAYIGGLNPQHYEVALLMLEHGKHVLLERPMTMTEKQSRKLIAYAELKKLFLLEGIWSRFFPAYQYMKRQISSGVLGDIIHVDVELGFNLAANNQLRQKDVGDDNHEMDFGVYVIQMSQWVFQQAPKTVQATGTLNDQGIALTVEAKIDYGGGRTARLETSSLERLENRAIITGTKGFITVPIFWCPPALIDIDGKEKKWPLPHAKSYFHFVSSCGLRYEAEEVRKMIRAKKLQSEHLTHNETLIIAKIQDEILKQIGVKFPEDDSTK